MSHRGMLLYVVFQGDGVLGENWKKLFPFMLGAMRYSTQNQGYRACREAPTHHTKYNPKRFVTYTWKAGKPLLNLREHRAIPLDSFSPMPLTSAPILLPDFPLIPQAFPHILVVLLLMKAV